MTITSPTDGSNLTASSVIITGMLITSGDTGVKINVTGAGGTTEYLAEVNQGYFAAVMELEEGANTIKVAATDANGKTEEKSITVNAITTSQAVKISANPESGISTIKMDGTTSFSTTLTSEVNVPDAIFYSWDIDGDGRADQEGIGLTEVTTNYQTHGFYFPTVTVTDINRNTYTATTIVNVLDKDQIDTLLKGKWEGMKGALLSGDIESALGYFVDGSKDRYRQVFTELATALSSIFSNTTEIKLEKLYGKVAGSGAIITEADGTYSYPVTFVKDDNGIWKIVGF